MEKEASFLTERELAIHLKISVQILARMRKTKQAPPHIEIGGRNIRYPVADLEWWIDEKMNSKESILT